jgi:hypothetical protein
MILEKTVKIKWNGRNKQYLISKGYIFSEIGEETEVKVEHLSKGSPQKVTKICDEDGCGKVVIEQIYATILKQRKNGKDRCFECAMKITNSNKINILYENSLEYYAKTNNKEYLLKEFSNKNEKKPSNISRGSKKACIWNCPICKSEYAKSIKERTGRGGGCPYCAGQRINIGYNDLWTTHPHVAKLLKDKRRGYELTYGSNKKERFYCNECCFEKTTEVYKIARNGFSCMCIEKISDGISYPEKFMMELLSQLSVKFITQKSFSWAKNKRYDFYIEDLNNKIIIETHGEQHYTGSFEIKRGRSLIEEQMNDEYKMKKANDSNCITHYITIDCRKSELGFIKNSIINSEMPNLFSLSIINWLKVHEYASTSNLLKEVCDIWNDGVTNSVTIGEIVKLHRNTVIKYLKRGNELGWCNYDSKRQMSINSRKNGKKNSIAVVQLGIDNNFIKTWESASEVGKILGITSNSVSSMCKGNGKYKTVGSFKWLYKSDYDETIKTLDNQVV